LGLSEKQAKRGLRKCDFNNKLAIEYIFEHPDDSDSEEEFGFGEEIVSAHNTKRDS
jgi:hypothetical protein